MYGACAAEAAASETSGLSVGGCPRAWRYFRPYPLINYAPDLSPRDDAAQLPRGATQAFGATRARLLAENLGDFAPSDVVAPRSDGAARTAKYQAALEGGHDVLVPISEVWGGFSPEAMRFLGELSQARNDGIDIERASATWSTSSFTSYHGQLLSLAVQWGVAIEIERAVKKSARFC